MRRIAKKTAVCVLLLCIGSLFAVASAADVKVLLTDGRTLRGSFVQNESNANQLAIEIRNAGSTIRRKLNWSQVASVKVLSSQEPYEPINAIRREPQIELTNPIAAEANQLPLSELIVSAQPVSTNGKTDWDALRLSLRGLDQRGQSVALFGTLTITLWGQRQEVARVNPDQLVTIPKEIEQLATWTRSLDSEIERLNDLSSPVGARQGRSGDIYEDTAKYSWGAGGPDGFGQNVASFVGRRGRGRMTYEDNPQDVLQLLLPLPHPLPDQDPRRSPIGDVSVELMMPGVGVFSATSSDVVLTHQSALRQYRLEREGTRFFPNERTTGNQNHFGSVTNRSLWPERRTLNFLP